MNASGGIYWRSAPDWNTAEAVAGNGFYPNTLIAVRCYQSGAGNVPGSADTMWEQATDVGGQGTGSGWINEHFINDGSAINQPSPGVPPCGQQTSTPPPVAGPPTTPPAGSSGSSGSHPKYVVAARWLARPLGATLSITPTGYAQTVGISAASGVWNNTFTLVPYRPYSSAVYHSLYEQLQCHLFFRFKTPFNLDTWRPSVSWVSELRHRCNP